MILHHEFIRIAKIQKDKLAFNDKSTAKKLTYQESLIASLLLARFFKHFDDHHLGIMLPTSAGCGLAVLATLMAGKVPAMINYSTGAQQNILYARDMCGFNTIVTSRTILQKVNCPEMPGMVFIEDLLKKVSTLDKIRAAAKSKLPLSILFSLVKKPAEDDTAAIIFTSGSEKAPKGVELTHKNISANIASIRRLIPLDDSYVQLAILPFFHVFGFTTNLWLPLFCGMEIITYANPLEAKNIAKIIKDDKPNFLIGTPFFLMSYERFADPGDFASLELVVAGADKTPDWLFDTFKRNHGIEIIEGYGATETSPVVSVNPPEAIRRGSIGKPLPGVEVKIIDLETGKELPAGREGKLLVKGDNVMKGYFGDIEETTLKIENHWYETGDMGLIDEDGYIWHKGRLKRFVKIGGEMVSLVLVEAEMEKILSEGIECCVVDIPDRKKGATIVAATTNAIDEKAMKKRLKEVLPPIALPKHFVVIKEMPKMGSGKIDFRNTTIMVREMLASEEHGDQQETKAPVTEA